MISECVFNPHYKGKCGWRVNIMTGVFSADSQPAAERGGEMQSESKADGKRGSCLLSHQQMGAVVIKSIFTLS